MREITGEFIIIGGIVAFQFVSNRKKKIDKAICIKHLIKKL